MLRVPFALFAILVMLASSSTANAGAIVSAGSGTTLIGGSLFETDEARLKFALLNGEDSAGLSNPFIPLTDVRAASPLIEGDVIFSMIVAGGGPQSNMNFQYGATGTDPKLPGGMVGPSAIPEPATLLLLAPAVALAMRRRLRTAHR